MQTKEEYLRSHANPGDAFTACWNDLQRMKRRGRWRQAGDIIACARVVRDQNLLTVGPTSAERAIAHDDLSISLDDWDGIGSKGESGE